MESTTKINLIQIIKLIAGNAYQIIKFEIEGAKWEIMYVTGLTKNYIEVSNFDTLEYGEFPNVEAAIQYYKSTLMQIAIMTTNDIALQHWRQN